jgi:hypothetical protein
MRKTISTTQIEELERRCGGRCEICGAEQGPKRKLAIDHDHETGHVRGLLCRQCNLGLGAFDDRILLLISAVEYLQRKPAIKAHKIVAPVVPNKTAIRRAERMAWWTTKKPK